MKNLIKDFGLIIVIILVSLIIALIIKWLGEDNLFFFSESNFKILTLLFSIIIFSIIYYFIKKQKVSKKQDVILFQSKLVILIFIFYFLFKIYLILFFINYNFLDFPNRSLKTIKSFFFIVLLAPIKEELFYRGIIFYLIGRTRKGNFILIFAILFTSLLFAAMHMQFNANFIDHFIFSVILCIIYFKNKNLLQVMFFHIINNFLAFLNVFFMMPTKMNIIFSNFILIAFMLLTLYYIFKLKKTYE